MFARAWGEKELGATANEYGVSFWKDENLLMLDSGDEYTKTH